jgi:hypothetical protein
VFRNTSKHITFYCFCPSFSEVSDAFFVTVLTGTSYYCFNHVICTELLCEGARMDDITETTEAKGPKVKSGKKSSSKGRSLWLAVVAEEAYFRVNIKFTGVFTSQLLAARKLLEHAVVYCFHLSAEDLIESLSEGEEAADDATGNSEEEEEREDVEELEDDGEESEDSELNKPGVYKRRITAKEVAAVKKYMEYATSEEEFDPADFIDELKQFFPDIRQDRHECCYGFTLKKISVIEDADELDGVILM